MNNQIPYFLNTPNYVNNTLSNYPNIPNIDNERIIEIINKLEKKIKNLEMKVSKLESNNNDTFQYDSTDMYII